MPKSFCQLDVGVIYSQIIFSIPPKKNSWSPTGNVATGIHTIVMFMDEHTCVQDVPSELYGPMMLTLSLVAVLLYGMKSSGHEVVIINYVLFFFLWY